MMRVVLLVLAAACAGAQDVGTLLSGTIPRSLDSPARVTWIAADEQELSLGCSIPLPSVWTCKAMSPLPRGLVVIVGAQEGVAAVPVGLPGVASTPLVGKWGRLVRLVGGGAAPGALHDLKAGGWRPLRPTARLLTTRFTATEDPGIMVLRLGDDAFWVASYDVDPDAYVRVDGPEIASLRLAVNGLSSGPPDLPVFVDISPPFSIQGQVVDEHGQDVQDAIIELWEGLRPQGGGQRDSDADKSLLRWAVERSDAQGHFEFARIAPGTYELAAIHRSAGRATVTVSSLPEPVLLKLKTPALATGRVLRHGLAVEGARVRFVPDVTALAESADPAAHVGDESHTDAEGRFLVGLPPVRVGVLQVSGPDGSSVRVQLPATPASRRVLLGDITLPDGPTVIARLMDTRECELTAAGPVGEIGLAVVPATIVSMGVFHLALPEAGTWVLDARCDGRTYNLDPPVVVVPANGPDVLIDVRLLPAAR